jgi:hypothetical protein
MSFAVLPSQWRASCSTRNAGNGTLRRLWDLGVPTTTLPPTVTAFCEQSACCGQVQLLHAKRGHLALPQPTVAHHENVHAVLPGRRREVLQLSVRRVVLIRPGQYDAAVRSVTPT